MVSQGDMRVLSVYRRLTLKRLQRLNPCTPALHFLSGFLPAPALVHQQQYTLLHMVAMLGPSNILNKHGVYLLHHSIKDFWLSPIRDLSQQEMLHIFSLESVQLCSRTLPKPSSTYLTCLPPTFSSPSSANSSAGRQRISDPSFFLDPCTDPGVIELVQLSLLISVFRALRAWVWCAQRVRMRMLWLESFLE